MLVFLFWRMRQVNCSLFCLWIHFYSPTQTSPMVIMSQHALTQKVLSEGVQLWQRALVKDEGREDPNTTISGPSTARQRNADNGPPKIECWLGSFVIFQGIQTRIAKKPYCFFVWPPAPPPPPPPPPPLDPLIASNTILIFHWQIQKHHSNCHEERDWISRCTSLTGNPEPSVLFVGRRQTVQTQNRRDQCLQFLLTECSIKNWILMKDTSKEMDWSI